VGKLGPLLLCRALVLIAFTLPGCGGSSRQLPSLSISAAAGATQVQFTTVACWLVRSRLQTVNAVWWTTQPWTYPPTPFTGTASSSGLARCKASAPAGTYSIWAVAPVDQSVPVSTMTMTTKQVSATGQLTCP
jgi:hypothetical protein